MPGTSETDLSACDQGDKDDPDWEMEEEEEAGEESQKEGEDLDLPVRFHLPSVSSSKCNQVCVSTDCSQSMSSMLMCLLLQFYRVLHTGFFYFFFNSIMVNYKS